MPEETRKPVIEILDREDVLPRLDLLGEMPLAPADVVPVGNRDIAGRKEDRPGQLADAGEARNKLANMNLDADVAGAIAAAVANIPDMDDEIDDAAAAAFVNRRRGAVGHVPHEPVPENPPPPQNLPAVMAGTGIFARDPNYRAQNMPVEPKWLNIYDLPGYMQGGIRALGRFTFRSFGCFQEHERMARDAGHDPLGSIRILADIQGQGPSKRAELDAAATWIRDNGAPIEASELDFGMTIPGYNPRIILSASEDESFLMVEESRERGAPANAIYIYSWKGGRTWYLGGEGRMERLAAMAPVRAIAAPARQLAGPAARADVPRRRVQQADRIVAPARPLPPMPAVVAPLDKAARREKLSKLQEAPIRSGLSVELRRAGFLPLGSQTVPTLRKPMEDGFTAEVTAPEGYTLVSAPELELKIVDSDGDTWNETSVSTLADAEAAIAAHRLPTP